jgi:flagellar basal-body rod protein FlgG
MDNAVYATDTGMIKREGLVTTTFGEYVTYRITNGQRTEIGTTTHGCIADSVYADLTRGSVVRTGRSLDLAIDGNGFFRIAYENGNTGLTRNGNFSVNEEGFLTTSTGAYVMGKNGRINLGSASNLSFGLDGAVSAGGQYIDTLDIVTPENPAALEKQAEGVFTDTGGNTGAPAKVLQGILEMSNVDLTQEMMAMIEESRAFQSCSQVMRILDSINEKTVNEIGSVR